MCCLALTSRSSRVLFLLATDHLPAPACCDALMQSALTCRRALETLEQLPDDLSRCSELGRHLDARLQLAHALVTIAEHDESAFHTSLPASNTRDLRTEASELFAQAVRLQIADLEARVRASTTPAAPDSADGSMSDAEQPQEVMVEQGSLVTVHDVVATLSAALDNKLELVPESPAGSAPSSGTLSAASECLRTLELLEALEREHENVLGAPADAEDQLARLSIRARAEGGRGADSLFLSVSGSLSSHPSFLTAFADHLSDDDILASSDPAEARERLARARTLTANAITIIKDRYSPAYPRSLRPHDAELIRSRMHASNARIALQQAAIERPDSPNSHLGGARSEATVAYNAAGYPAKRQDSSAQASAVEATLISLRTAILARSQGDPLDTVALGQLAAVVPDLSARRKLLQAYVEEVQDDFVWQHVPTEVLAWRDVAARLA